MTRPIKIMFGLFLVVCALFVATLGYSLSLEISEMQNV